MTAFSALASIFSHILPELKDLLDVASSGLLGVAEAYALPAHYMKVQQSLGDLEAAWASVPCDASNLHRTQAILWPLSVLAKDLAKALGSLSVVVGAFISVIPGLEPLGSVLILIGAVVKIVITLGELIYKLIKDWEEIKDRIIKCWEKNKDCVKYNPEYAERRTNKMRERKLLDPVKPVTPPTSWVTFEDDKYNRRMRKNLTEPLPK